MNHIVLIRYLSDESSAEEKYEVGKWLEAEPEHSRLLKEMELIWKASSKGPEPYATEFNAEADWKTLQFRIKNEIDSAPPNQKKIMKRTDTGKLYKHSRSAKNKDIAQFMRVAAVLFIAILGGVFAWQNFYAAEPGQEFIMREIVMDKGQRANLVLSDGTNVNLNADSKISIPEVFRTDKREVFLQSGEAYFDVTGDADWPFLIHSRGAVIRVLGTSFVVRSYPEDEMVRIVVNEGTVTVASGQDESRETTLKAGQLGLFHIENDRITSEEVEDLEQYLSWIDGYLIFRNTPMKEVALQLERRYNAEVDFSEPELEELRLTATLKGRSISNVMDVIAGSLEIGYFKTGRQRIVFTDRDNRPANELME
ncbi:MAG: FecR domain-containing protein [Balneolales bacterium]